MARPRLVEVVTNAVAASAKINTDHGFSNMAKSGTFLVINNTDDQKQTMGVIEKIKPMYLNKVLKLFLKKI